MQFQKVVGLESIKKHLIRQVQENKVPHAQLFLNRPGAGGLPLALAFAQYLVCQNPSDTDSCGVCPSCGKAQKLIHPDIHMTYPVIRPENSNKIPLSEHFALPWRTLILKNPYVSEYEWLHTINTDIKQGNITREEASKIIQNLNLKSFENGYKVQIIWMAENLAEVGNALLKIIEEPPEKSVIILVAENQEAILSTIISRTQILQIPDLKEAEITERLIQDFQLNQETAKEYAYISSGSFRKAQQLASGEVEGFSEDLKNWLVYCMRGPSADLVKWTETRHAKGREYLKKFFDYTIQIFRETLVSKYTNNELMPRVSKIEIPVTQALMKYIDHDNLYELIPRIEETAYHIERNSNAKISLLNLSIDMRKILKK
ncbi:MAG TPA: hypothetical protein VLZ75_04225 [Chitinophagales bacterium]|nr:hypothetical protein [Chitinophagales bacterium]